MNSSSGRDVAQALVDAFQSFILPIVQVHSVYPVNPNKDGGVYEGNCHRNQLIDWPLLADQSSMSLSPEAQQLISALDKFVTAIVRPKKPVIPLQVKAQTFPAKPRLLQRALDGMHKRVFNRTPIRLLSFNADGTEFKLVERGEVWQRLSTAIERDYNEDKLKSDIRSLQSGKEKHTAVTAETAAIRAFLSPYGRYAILSHTWIRNMPGEVTYEEWNSGNVNQSSEGYRKLQGFCRIAAKEYHLTLGWMDTVCIDKSSSSELDESIRSMYKWYHQSQVCITYLADTTSLRDMQKDTWLTRGWTLQELIAPFKVKFYNKAWKCLAPGYDNDKLNGTVLGIINDAAGISRKELQDTLWTIPISRRMQWAAKREVTREEDVAYCLMGIFGVSISTAYGEGSAQAFFRLAQAILNTNTLNLLDIINWGYGPEFPNPSTIAHTSELIPSGPKQYLYRARTDIHWYRPTKPVTLTHLGLHVPVLIMPSVALPVEGTHTPTPIGHYYATANIELLYPGNNTTHSSYAVLDRLVYAAYSHNIAVFGVMNFSETSSEVILPQQGISYAIPFRLDPSIERGLMALEDDPVFHRISIKQAVVFELKALGHQSFTIMKGDLKKHGISLRTLYL